MEGLSHACSTTTPEVAGLWQDMLELTTSRVRDLLQAVLRSKSVLKVSCKLIKAVYGNGCKCQQHVSYFLGLYRSALAWCWTYGQ